MAKLTTKKMSLSLQHPLKLKVNLDCPKKLAFLNASWNKKNLKDIVNFILSLLVENQTEVNIRFCDEAEMLQANEYFRKISRTTDVLSFPPSVDLKNSHGNVDFLGDILICLPYCVTSAKKGRRSISAELAAMIIHGIIHLKGFDHERGEAAYKVMRTLERVIFNQLIAQFQDITFVEVQVNDSDQKVRRGKQQAEERRRR